MTSDNNMRDTYAELALIFTQTKPAEQSEEYFSKPEPNSTFIGKISHKLQHLYVYKNKILEQQLELTKQWPENLFLPEQKPEMFRAEFRKLYNEIGSKHKQYLMLYEMFWSYTMMEMGLGSSDPHILAMMKDWQIFSIPDERKGVEISTVVLKPDDFIIIGKNTIQ